MIIDLSNPAHLFLSCIIILMAIIGGVYSERGYKIDWIFLSTYGFALLLIASSIYSLFQLIIKSL